MFNHYSNRDYESFVQDFATIFIDLDENLTNVTQCQVAIFEDKKMTTSKIFDVTSETYFNKSFSEVLDIIGNRPIVLYNANYIRDLIYQNVDEVNRERMKNLSWVCAYEMYTVREPLAKSHSLNAVIEKYNVYGYFFNMMNQEKIASGKEFSEIRAIFIGIVFIILVSTMPEHEYGLIQAIPEFCNKRIMFYGNSSHYSEQYLEYLASRASMKIITDPQSPEDIDFIVTKSWNDKYMVYFKEKIERYNHNNPNRCIGLLTECRFAEIVNSKSFVKLQ